MKIGDRIDEYLIIILLVAFPFARISVPNGHEIGMLLLCCIISIIINVIFISKKYRDNMSNISLVDLVIYLFSIYIIVRNSVSIGCLDIESIMICVCCLCIYHITILCSHKTIRVIEKGLIAAGFVQSIICMFQIVHILQSNHTLFAATGSFDNPAHCGMLMALVLPLVTTKLFAKKKGSCQIHYMLYVVFITIFATLIISESRTSWLCAVIIFSVITLDNKKKRLLHIFKEYPFLIISVIVVLTTLLLLFLYYIKPVSANSRLYIWSIALRCVLEHPIFGVGRSFSHVYMNKQADFLMSNLDSPFFLLADNIHHCYNEFLQILIQYGVVGLLLIILTFGLTLRTKSKNTIIKASVVGYLVASMFTYVTCSFPFLLLLSFYMGVLNKGSHSKYQSALCKFSTDNYFAIVLSILKKMFMMGFTSICVCYGFAIYYWSKGIRAYEYKCYEEAEEYFNKCEFVLTSNGYYLNYRAKCLTLIGDYDFSNKILKTAFRIRYSSFSEIALGENYNNLGDLDKSEISYKKAYAMVPSRIYPLYLMAVQQYNNGEYEKFRKTAEIILNMPTKVQSTANIQMREEVSGYLKKIGLEE